MTSTADIPLKEPAVSAAAGDAEQLERARIDASTRVPVLMFYASAMVWLLIGTLLAGFVFRSQFSDLGPPAPGPNERDDLWVGINGRNGNGDLADGAIVPDNVAT